MGICLHVFVEVAQAQVVVDPQNPRGPMIPGPGKCWWVLSTVEFNKNYELMRRLHDHPKVQREWPKDVSSEVKRQEEEQCIEQGRCWCDAETFTDVLALDTVKGDEEEDVRALSGQAEALEAFLVVMAREPWVRGLRLLFWES
jgi:hypothetical protein